MRRVVVIPLMMMALTGCLSRAQRILEETDIRGGYDEASESASGNSHRQKKIEGK